MSVETADCLVGAAQIYLAAGLVFAVPFAWRGVERLDPLARQSTLGFRLLICPGASLLWPLLAMRLLAGRTQPPEEWTAHRAAAGTPASEGHVVVSR